MKEKKITVLVEKVNVERYRELKREGIYPLIVETDFLDIFEAKEYYKESNLYKLKIEFLKEHCWRRTCKNKGIDYEKDVLEFADNSKCDILKPVEALETESKEDGIVVKSPIGENFISMEKLYNRALGMENKNEEKNNEVRKDNKENIIIVSRVANLDEYEIMRGNKSLPLVIVLTELQSRIISIPFDGLYIKTNLVHNNRSVFTLDLMMLKQMIATGKIDLEGIRLEDGKVHKIDNLFGGDYDSLGSFAVGERKEEVMELTKKLLEPKEIKASQTDVNVKEPYLY